MSGFSIETIALIAKSRLEDEHFSQTDENVQPTLRKIAGGDYLSFDPLDYIETSPNTESENIGLVIIASRVECANKDVLTSLFAHSTRTNNMQPGSSGTVAEIIKMM